MKIFIFFENWIVDRSCFQDNRKIIPHFDVRKHNFILKIDLSAMSKMLKTSNCHKSAIMDFQTKNFWDFTQSIILNPLTANVAICRHLTFILSISLPLSAYADLRKFFRFAEISFTYLPMLTNADKFKFNSQKWSK